MDQANECLEWNRDCCKLLVHLFAAERNFAQWLPDGNGKHGEALRQGSVLQPCAGLVPDLQ